MSNCILAREQFSHARAPRTGWTRSTFQFLAGKPLPEYRGIPHLVSTTGTKLLKLSAFGKWQNPGSKTENPYNRVYTVTGTSDSGTRQRGPCNLTQIYIYNVCLAVQRARGPACRPRHDLGKFLGPGCTQRQNKKMCGRCARPGGGSARCGSEWRVQVDSLLSQK